MKHEHDEIDAALFAGDEYLADDGFSDRVMAALPPTRRRRWRSAIILGFTVAAAAVGAAALPIDLLVANLATLDLGAPLTLAAGVSLLVALGSAAMAASDI